LDIPTGTQVALVKQALLIDNSGQIQPSPITEQVQIRVDYDLGKLPGAFEFRLARKSLFDGKGGGLYPVSDGERHFSVFLATRRHHGELDPFEHSFPLADKQIPLERPPSDNHNLMQSCLGCHQANRRPGFGSFLTNGPRTDRESLVGATIDWKRQHSTWARLRGLTWGNE
jgi:hypothetical protein